MAAMSSGCNRASPWRSPTRTPNILQHDASTLGDYAGWPVIDLISHTVLGLHFGGRYGVGNLSITAKLTTAPTRNSRICPGSGGA
jgi:hypothetical protein